MPSPPQESNYLFLEPLIVTRLNGVLSAASVSPLPHVMSLGDLADYEAQRNQSPIIAVLLADDSPGDRVQPSGEVRIDQTWEAVVVISNHRNTPRGDGVRNTAGVLIPHVINALQGWRWGDTPRETFTRTRASSRPTGRNGFLYYPLAFSTSFVSYPV